MGLKKTKPDKMSPLQEARLLAMVGDSRAKVLHSKATIRKSKSMSAASREAIDLAKSMIEANRSSAPRNHD